MDPDTAKRAASFVKDVVLLMPFLPHDRGGNTSIKRVTSKRYSRTFDAIRWTDGGEQTVEFIVA